jgi:hypothetical protein
MEHQTIESVQPPSALHLADPGGEQMMPETIEDAPPNWYAHEKEQAKIKRLKRLFDKGSLSYSRVLCDDWRSLRAIKILSVGPSLLVYAACFTCPSIPRTGSAGLSGEHARRSVAVSPCRPHRSSRLVQQSSCSLRQRRSEHCSRRRPWCKQPWRGYRDRSVIFDFRSASL